MSLANEADIDEERESEEEIKRIREAMAKMEPGQRKLYEMFVSSFWPKVIEDLKKEKKNE